MSQDSPAPVRRWPVCIAGGILGAVLFLAIWVPVHPARPHLPTSDLYTHLSVARHLARGDGFLTDITYPLSFAFPFARELPQPLIHRQPGFAVLLTVPYLAGGGYPSRAVDQVRRLQILLLGFVLATGTAFFLRRYNQAAVVPWLVFLFFNPLLVFAVDWGMVELACALLLLILWLRMCDKAPDRPNWIDGLLAGAVCMFRLDLFWVPLLWWTLSGAFSRRTVETPRRDTRRLGLVFLVWVLVLTPWAVRNLQVTGQPFFSLQSYAEHVKDTSVWQGYSVYRQLDPQPFFQTMTSDPVPVLRKVGRGMKFYFRDLDGLVPLLVLVGLAWGALAFLTRRLTRDRGSKPGHSRGPLALTCLTALLLSIQYSFFDHSLRHLLVLLPVMLWEFSFWIGIVVPRTLREPARRFHLPATRGAGIVLAAVAALAIVFLYPCRIPGWNSAAAEAVNLAPRTAQQIDRLRGAPAGVLFATNSAVPWFIDRPVVWAPAEQTARTSICELLDRPEANP